MTAGKRTFLIFLLLLPAFSFGQKWAYLQKNQSGRIKKLKSKAIYHFQGKDSTWNAGRIIWVSDTTLVLQNAWKHHGPKMITLTLSDIIKIQNPLLHNEGLKEMAGWMIVGSALFVLMIPIVWIDDGWHEVRELFGVWGGILGVAGVLMTPYLFKRTFRLDERWQLIAK